LYRIGARVKRDLGDSLPGTSAARRGYRRTWLIMRRRHVLYVHNFDQQCRVICVGCHNRFNLPRRPCELISRTAYYGVTDTLSKETVATAELLLALQANPM
jgi:hypothetical protein